MIARAESTPTSVTSWLARLCVATLTVAVIFASLGLAAAAAFQLAYRGRMYPGVQLWGADLSGMTLDEATEVLAGAFTYPRTASITFHDGSRTWTVTPADLGVDFDLPATVTAAYSVGRTGHLGSDLQAQFDAWYVGAQLAPIVRFDEARALLYLNTVAEVVFVPTREAALTFDGAHVQATPGQVGRQMDVLAARDAVRAALPRLEPVDVTLTFIETPPLVLDASAQAAAAEAILSQPLTLVIKNPAPGDLGPWVLEPTTLGTMLKINRVDDGPNAAHFEVGLDPAALQAYLSQLAPGLERTEPVNARFIFNDDTRQLELLQPGQSARSLDVAATLRQINLMLAQGVHTVPLEFRTIAPAVGDNATAEQLGITQLVSQQATFFRGSGPERINNIKVAAARYHGLLIAPNATFSFGAYLGDVSLDTGFAEALIIFGGRTIRGVGGGVCQVATTIFRAAYFGGFPIVERNPHAYQVHYYDKGVGLTPYGTTSWNGPGLDATVYTPIVDFKFRNDTPYWLLMETYVDEKNSRLTWKFYSTWDGRQVALSGPEISNVIPAPETLYEFDETVPPGEIKQVDFAADGADVVVRRVVTRDGVVINSDEKPLLTKYQPWRAIYHYGTGAEGIPIPAPQ